MITQQYIEDYWNKISNAFPDWKEMTITARFEQWRVRQTVEVQNYLASINADDVIFALKKYQQERNQPSLRSDT